MNTPTNSPTQPIIYDYTNQIVYVQYEEKDSATKIGEGRTEVPFSPDIIYTCYEVHQNTGSNIDLQFDSCDGCKLFCKDRPFLKLKKQQQDCGVKYQCSLKWIQRNFRPEDTCIIPEPTATVVTDTKRKRSIRTVRTNHNDCNKPVACLADLFMQQHNDYI